MNVGFIQLFRLFSAAPHGDIDTGPSEASHSASFHMWIGIKHGDHDSSETGLDQSGHAWRGSFAGMATGLERHIQRPAASPCTGFPEREHFSVGLAGAVMISLPNDAAFPDDDRPDHWVRACASPSPGRKTQRALHVRTIEIAVFHRVLRDAEVPPAVRVRPAGFFARAAALALPFLFPGLEAAA